MTAPLSFAVAASTTSGLCSITCARSAVRFGWTCFEISPRTDSVVSTSSMPKSDPTSMPYVPPISTPSGPPMTPMSRLMTPPLAVPAYGASPTSLLTSTRPSASRATTAAPAILIWPCESSCVRSVSAW
jgi:hypothetical protein